MKLTLFTASNCPRCPKAEEVVEKVKEKKGIELGLQVEYLNVDSEEAMLTALQHNIISTPSIMINEEVVYLGEVPTEAGLIKELEKRK